MTVAIIVNWAAGWFFGVCLAAALLTNENTKHGVAGARLTLSLFVFGLFGLVLSCFVWSCYSAFPRRPKQVELPKATARED